jgi:hypothetical protein
MACSQGRADRAGRSRLGPVRVGILGISVAALVGVPIGWQLTRPPDAVGSLPPAPRQAPYGVVVNVAAPRVPRIALHSAWLNEQPQPRAQPFPTEIEIPSIGVRADVVRVGVEWRSSSIQVPGDVNAVGWYRFGSVPGEAGGAILVGHVDSAAQGPGAFFRLRDLQPGSVIKVRLSHAGTRTFRVRARRTYLKGHLPSGMFRTFGPPVLALVTCGGAFDTATRHYADNVVVYAMALSP